MILTYRLRLKDKHASHLDRHARAVNFVWNYCNETQRKAFRESRRLLSAYDLNNLTAGTSRDLGILATSIEAVCQQHYQSRRQSRRPWLRWRGKRSLGWVPFKGQGGVRFDGATFTYSGVRYEPMHIRDGVAVGLIGAGSFNADAAGHWYINFAVEVPEYVGPPDHTRAAGLDLGLHALVTASSGDKIAAPRLYRASEAAIVNAQRARKTRRARAIHARAANRRRDFLHKASTKLVNEFGFIVVGDVSPSRLSKTGMAKSVHDAGWYAFKQMLAYKMRLRRGGGYLEVSEKLSSQTCSSCGALPAGRPGGIAGLGIREWTCGDCGAVHDRDVNAARNILRAGLGTLAEGAGDGRSSQPLKALSSPRSLLPKEERNGG